MKKYKNIKKLLSFSVITSMAITGAGSLSGCTGINKAAENSESKSIQEEKGVDKEGTSDSKAMGRYLETDLAVPKGCGEIMDLQILEDGTMELLARDESWYCCLYRSTDKGKTWDTGTKVADLLGMDSSGEDPVYKAALGKDGSVLAGNYIPGEDEASMGKMEYYYCPAGGNVTKLELGSAVEGTFAFDIKIGANGNLFLLLVGDGILEVNPEAQTVAHEYEKGEHVDYMSVTTKYLIVMESGDVKYYDLETGKPAEGGDALTSQLKKNPSNLTMGNSSGFSILFMDGDEDNSLFYVDDSGLYRYVFGGNVVEQLIDGSLNSLGAVNKAFSAMVKDEEGAFYIGELDYSSGDFNGKIFSYSYSSDIPTVPDTELTLYSLEDNSSIRQAVVMFQKKYPDIYITLETGMSGDDGVTRTDALKTLNTEIMAGKGPDILILDGISAQTYVEQGMLEDLSGIFKDAGLLTNIKDAYTNEDGSIYEMPVKFGIPVIEGKKEDVDLVTDLTSLADVAESHKEEYGISQETFYKFPMCYFLYPQVFLQELCDNNSAAWLNEDGTLSEEKVKEFLEQAGRIYKAGEDGLNEFKEKYAQEFADSEEAPYNRLEGIASENILLLWGTALFAVGGVFSPYDFATVDSIAKQGNDLSYKLWNGQISNCFLPVCKVGVSSKSLQKEAAMKFVQYLFSEEGQQVSKNDGLPVVESVYDSDAYWDQGEVGKVLTTGGGSNSETGQEVNCEITVPEADKVEEFKALGKTLTTPVLDNAIITGAVSDTGVRYLNNEISLDEAANAVIQQVNLYLSE